MRWRCGFKEEENHPYFTWNKFAELRTPAKNHGAASRLLTGWAFVENHWGWQTGASGWLIYSWTRVMIIGTRQFCHAAGASVSSRGAHKLGYRVAFTHEYHLG